MNTHITALPSAAPVPKISRMHNTPSIPVPDPITMSTHLSQEMLPVKQDYVASFCTVHGKKIALLVVAMVSIVWYMRHRRMWIFKSKCSLSIPPVTTDCKLPRTPVRLPRTPVSSPRTPVRSPRTPVRSPRTPVRSPRTPVRSPRTPVRSPRTPVRSPHTPPPVNILPPTPNNIPVIPRGSIDDTDDVEDPNFTLI